MFLKKILLKEKNSKLIIKLIINIFHYKNILILIYKSFIIIKLLWFALKMCFFKYFINYKESIFCDV